MEKLGWMDAVKAALASSRNRHTYIDVKYTTQSEIISCRVYGCGIPSPRRHIALQASLPTTSQYPAQTRSRSLEIPPSHQNMDKMLVHRYFESGRFFSSTCGPFRIGYYSQCVFQLRVVNLGSFMGGSFLGYFKVHIGWVCCYLEA